MSSPKCELWRKGGSLLRDAFEDEEENGWTWPNKKSNILNKKFRNRSRVIADGMKEIEINWEKEEVYEQPLMPSEVFLCAVAKTV